MCLSSEKKNEKTTKKELAATVPMNALKFQVNKEGGGNCSRWAEREVLRGGWSKWW